MSFLKQTLSIFACLIALCIGLIYAVRSIGPVNLRLSAGDVAGAIGYMILSGMVMILLLYIAYRFGRYGLGKAK